MKKLMIILLSCLCMLTMILFGPTVSASAKEGVELCVRVVIPSLFPFFVVCAYLNGHLSDVNLQFLRPVEKLCRMPRGSGSILLLGLLGGYPVGAQSISQQYERGSLSRTDAQRLLGFCNNAGPAFLFGMLSAFFPSPAYLWTLWVIQILSAFLTGVFLPGRSIKSCTVQRTSGITIPQALERSVRSILLVCGWVILFRVLLTPLSKVPLFGGIMELTNGCMQLNTIPSIGIRFVVASVFLSFGGFCVHMQTLSAANGLDLKYYFCGKLLQTLIALILSVAVIFLSHCT